MRVKPTKRRKRVETEVGNIDQAPTISSGEGDSSEKGGFEENLEQPMLSPTAEQGAPTPIGAKERELERENEMNPSIEQLSTLKQRGKEKKRATTKECSNSESLAMLKEMK